jgi:hypothetical protein
MREKLLVRPVLSYCIIHSLDFHVTRFRMKIMPVGTRPVALGCPVMSGLQIPSEKIVCQEGH